MHTGYEDMAVFSTLEAARAAVPGFDALGELDEAYLGDSATGLFKFRWVPGLYCVRIRAVLPQNLAGEELAYLDEPTEHFRTWMTSLRFLTDDPKVAAKIAGASLPK